MELENHHFETTGSGMSLRDMWTGLLTRKVCQPASKQETFGHSDRGNSAQRIGQESVDRGWENKREERKWEKHKGCWGYSHPAPPQPPSKCWASPAPALWKMPRWQRWPAAGAGHCTQSTTSSCSRPAAAADFPQPQNRKQNLLFYCLLISWYCLPSAEPAWKLASRGAWVCGLQRPWPCSPAERSVRMGLRPDAQAAGRARVPSPEPLTSLSITAAKAVRHAVAFLV